MWVRVLRSAAAAAAGRAPWALVRGPMLVALVAVSSHACCRHPEPVFTVEPPLVCPGQVVEVQWNVYGKAKLRVERGANDWDEEDVPSSGRRRVAPGVTTTFKLTLADVNPAEGPSWGVKKVEITKPFDERRVVSECDAAAGRCAGSFDLVSGSPALQVRRLSSPRLIQGGHAQAMEVCVTHDGLPRTCVAPGQTIDVGVVANGTWKLEAALPGGVSVTPPPALGIHLDFACP